MIASQNRPDSDDFPPKNKVQGRINTLLINKLHIKSKCIEVYEGFAPRPSKACNCNQILGHVAD